MQEVGDTSCAEPKGAALKAEEQCDPPPLLMAGTHQTCTAATAPEEQSQGSAQRRTARQLTQRPVVVPGFPGSEKRLDLHNRVHLPCTRVGIGWLAAPCLASRVKVGDKDGERDDTHVLLEVAQASPVSPPSCPHPGPRLDLRTDTLPSDPDKSAVSQGHKTVRRLRTALRVPQGRNPPGPGELP